MVQITLRLSDALLDELDAEADEHGVSRSEHIRDTLESRRDTSESRDELQRVRAEYEAEIDDLETDLERCRRARRQLLDQRDEHGDLVRAVEAEQSLAEKRARASAFQRFRWWLTGFDDDED